jgi:N4-gp56 family major capsid protein
MAGLQGYSSFSNNAQTYISAQTLKRINKDVIVYGLGKKEKLPERFSKTFQYTRYERLDLPYAALTEGSTPADNAQMSISTVSAVMDQWGDFINLSDVAVITAKHPSLQKGIELLGIQASETIDRECIKLLLSNTSVSYGGAASSRVSLQAGEVLSSTVIKKAVAALRNQGARPAAGRHFVGLLDPSVEQDIIGDATFLLAAQYSNISALQNGEVGIWQGVRWMCSNLLPSMSRLADTVDGSADGGSLANSTSYYYQVVAVDNATGFEVASTQIITQATGAADESVTITMPATTGRKYNVYFGASNVTLKLSSSLNAPGAVVTVTAVPSSGAVPPAYPNTSIVAHMVWILGEEAFAVPELMSLQTFMTPAGASDSDPLAQRRKAGWKVMFKPVICNEDFLERIEVVSAY